MPLHIVRNDITRMDTEVIVNTANKHAVVGSGCDRAVYTAAGYEELLAYRIEHVGELAEGEVFLTPGFNLKARYIIHAVSPRFIDGEHGEEEKLRSCYRKSLELAKEHGVHSIAIPLISTGNLGYPKANGMGIAVDEINQFLLEHDMHVTLVVFDQEATELGDKLSSALEEYIDNNYVRDKNIEEYGSTEPFSQHVGSRAERVDFDINMLNERPLMSNFAVPMMAMPQADIEKPKKEKVSRKLFGKRSKNAEYTLEDVQYEEADAMLALSEEAIDFSLDDEDAVAKLEAKLNERLAHAADTYSDYLLYLIRSKGLTNAEVYNNAAIDKKVFSKIKNNKDYHPQKITALCLCVGAKLNMDETKDLLARAGYALSPCDLTDIIFSFYIENNHFDIYDIDIQLEEHGLPCIIKTDF